MASVASSGRILSTGQLVCLAEKAQILLHPDCPEAMGDYPTKFKSLCGDSSEGQIQAERIPS